MAVGYDTVIVGGTGSGNSSMTIDITVASNSNRALVLFVGGGSLALAVVTGVSGHGGTWSSVSGTDGNNTLRGSCWKNIAPDVGAGTITITFAGLLTQSAEAMCFSVYDCDQTTPVDSYSGTASGDVSITSDSGDLALSAMVNTNDVPAVTGSTTTEDLANFALQGYGAAHFAGPGPITFTWDQVPSGVAMGVNVNQVSGGGTAVVPILMRQYRQRWS